MSYEKDWKKEAGYLRDELDRRRYEDEQQQERDYQRRESERRQRQRDAQEALCYADNWEDAFCKALIRLQKEADDEKRCSEDYPDEDWGTYFQDEVKEHRFAQQVWREETKAIQAEIIRIREAADKQIAQLEQEARNKAAIRVDEKFPNAMVAENLRNDDFNNLVNW